MSIGGYYHELGSLMTSPLHTIIPRDASGRPGPPLTAADPVAMNIIRSISTCKNLMMHPTARDAFEKIAQDYAAARPNNWFRVHQPPMTTNEVTNTFLTKVLNTFPTVFIDYSLRNPDYGAYHSRRQWEENFEPKHQAISINGMNAEYLEKACPKIDEPPAPDDDLYSYQRCLFMTVNNLFHEMGHVFITWLSKGREETPPQINALAPGPLTSPGEAGRALENYTFGGQVLYFRDPKWKQGDRCGPAYLRLPSGADYRILPRVIKGLINYDLIIPYGHEKNPEPEGTLRSLGEGMPADTFTDPWASSEMADFLKVSAKP